MIINIVASILDNYMARYVYEVPIVDRYFVL